MKNIVLYCISAVVATLLFVAWVMGFIVPTGAMVIIMVSFIIMGYLPLFSHIYISYAYAKE